MAKFRMKYRPPVEGIKITVSDATYQRLKLATATNLHLIPPRARTPIKSAIGYWCESHLWTALEHEKLYPLPKPQIATSPSGKPHTFEIGASTCIWGLSGSSRIEAGPSISGLRRLCFMHWRLRRSGSAGRGWRRTDSGRVAGAGLAVPR